MQHFSADATIFLIRTSFSRLYLTFFFAPERKKPPQKLLIIGPKFKIPYHQKPLNAELGI